MQLVWFRSDLRTLDHAPLRAAVAAGPTVAVVALDVDRFRPHEHAFPRIGEHAAAFLLKSVDELRSALTVLGIPLIVRSDAPATAVIAAATELRAAAVHAHAEACTEERRAERAVRRGLSAVDGATLHLHDGMTMVLERDLPMPFDEIPEVFTRFRRAVERSAEFRRPEGSPPRQAWPELAGAAQSSEPHALDGIDLGRTPGLDELSLPAPATDERAVLPFPGGSTAALDHLDRWIHREGHAAHYKDTRNGMVVASDSSKFSPWLAVGCLSPRTVLAETQRYESEHGRTSGTEWLIVEMLWRDYFRFVARRAGPDLFGSGGIRRLDMPWRIDAAAEADFDRWRAGRTGVPMVDASMRELDATGFMSNRGRQIVASFLTKTLGVDWRWGARWFESRLIDHDPASNWANWNYIAGVGNDAREFRWFNPWSQAERYDADAAHARRWLPELAELDARSIHRPDPAARDSATDYPRPMVDVHDASDATRQRFESAGVGIDAPVGRAADDPNGPRRQRRPRGSRR